jgi:hypothetical protein
LILDLVISRNPFLNEDRMLIRPLLACIVLFCVSCGETARLTDNEKAKLDPDLQALFETPEPSDDRYEVSVRPDGSREYALVVRTSDPAELRAAGIAVGSVFGDVVTVRVTKAELRRILSLHSVRAVQNSTKSFPQ